MSQSTQNRAKQKNDCIQNCFVDLLECIRFIDKITLSSIQICSSNKHHFNFINLSFGSKLFILHDI